MSKRQRRNNEKQRRHRELVPSKRQVAKAGGVALGASLITGVAGAQAATFTVDNPTDTTGQPCTAAPNDCSLRSALENNNANNNQPTVDQVTFESGLTGTINTNSPLYISEPVDIQGPGADQITVHEAGGGKYVVFYINQTDPYDPVSISGLTIEDGDYSGIFNYDSTLTLNNAVVQENGYSAPANYGGGILNIFGDVTLNSSTVRDNFAYEDGGGIASIFGDATINSSTVTGNGAGNEGGGVFGLFGNLTVTNSSNVSYNGYSPYGGGTTTLYGGGIAARYSQSVIQGSTVSGNLGVLGGGGVFQVFGQGPAIQGSTIADNTAIFGGGLNSKYGGANVQGSTFSGNYGFYGGGFSSPEPYYPVAFSNSTLANNQAYRAGAGGLLYTNNSYPFSFSDVTVAGNSATGAPSYGGGLANATGDGPNPTLQNTIVSGNTATNGPDLYGPFDAAFSLVRDAGAPGTTVNTTVAGSNIFGVDPLLGALANNGGPTQTMALPQSSPAVDKGSSSSGSDQRGLSRPVDGAAIPNSSAPGGNGADIGAFELQGLPNVTPPKCKGKTATVFRANGRNLTGTNKRDVIVGTNKTDRINSRGGNDLVCAKGGKDTVKSGGGKDKVFGQGGKDKLRGGGGNDKLVGGAKKDRLFGQGGKDKLLGKGGKDRLVGGAKKDRLIGGGGNDTCVGGPGRDVEKSC